MADADFGLARAHLRNVTATRRPFIYPLAGLYHTLQIRGRGAFQNPITSRRASTYMKALAVAAAAVALAVFVVPAAAIEGAITDAGTEATPYNCTLVDYSAAHDRAVEMFGGQPIYRVASGSMEPVLSTGDLIVVNHTQFEDIQTNDIIVFYDPTKPNKTKVTVHRAVEIYDSVIHTKGDANPSRTAVDYAYPHSYIGRVQNDSFYRTDVRLAGGDPLILRFGDFNMSAAGLGGCPYTDATAAHHDKLSLPQNATAAYITTYTRGSQYYVEVTDNADLNLWVVWDNWFWMFLNR